MRTQKKNEPFNDYLNEIQEIATWCQFGSLTAKMVRDRLITGINDLNLQFKFKTMDDPSLEEVIENCREIERAKEKLNSIIGNMNFFFSENSVMKNEVLNGPFKQSKNSVEDENSNISTKNEDENKGLSFNQLTSSSTEQKSNSKKPKDRNQASIRSYLTGKRNNSAKDDDDQIVSENETEKKRKKIEISTSTDSGLDFRSENYDSDTDSDTPKERFSCHRCNNSYAYKTSLKRHLKNCNKRRNRDLNRVRDKKEKIIYQEKNNKNKQNGTIVESSTKDHVEISSSSRRLLRNNYGLQDGKEKSNCNKRNNDIETNQTNGNVDSTRSPQKLLRPQAEKEKVKHQERNDYNNLSNGTEIFRKMNSSTDLSSSPHKLLRLQVEVEKINHQEINYHGKRKSAEIPKDNADLNQSSEKTSFQNSFNHSLQNQTKNKENNLNSNGESSSNGSGNANSDEPLKKYVCNDCGSVLAHERSLKRHYTTCVIRNANSSTSYNTEETVDLNKSQNSFICDDCGVSYGVKSSLRHHRLKCEVRIGKNNGDTCSGKENVVLKPQDMFICDCGRSFAHKNNLNRHKEFCGKTDALIAALKSGTEELISDLLKDAEKALSDTE